LLLDKENYTMNIGSILSRAWQTIWKNKVLWIFGILAGCSGAGANASNAQARYQGQMPPEMQQFFNQFPRLPEWQVTVLAIILILVALVVVVVAIFLGTIGRIGLIRGTLEVDRGTAHLSFGDLFNGSLPYFWRVFGLNLLVGLAGFVIAIAIAIFVIFGSVITLGLGLICMVPLLCLLVPIGWIVSVIVEQASIAMVVENLGIGAGLQRGWDVFRNNLGPMIVMALILMLGVSLIGGFIIGLPLFFVALPAIFGNMSDSMQATGGGLLVAGLCLVAYLPVLILLNGILRGFIESAWTLTFLDLTRRPSTLEVEPASIT
jgi:hypothetical protein